MFTVYLRWAFPKAGAEVYGEFYREVADYNLREFYFELANDRAYTIGFQKVVQSHGWFNLFKINGEVNNLVPTRISEVRPQTYIYSHSLIRQGHTNQGQILGASIGPGSASEYLGAKGFFKQGDLGLFVQRVAVNDFFMFKYYNWHKDPRNVHGRIGAKDMWRHRINLNIGLNGRYMLGPLLLDAKIVWNKNFNYGRYNYGKLKGINFNNVEKNDIVNIQVQFSIRYNFGRLFQ
jgi:hypothetical protein